VLVDISGPFEAFKNGATPSLVCLHLTLTCGFVLIKRGEDAKDKVLYERIGLATGDVFEHWFADESSGAFEDELVRII